MNTTRWATPWLVVPVLAVIGLLIAVLPAYFLTGQAERFRAQTTVAMLPAPNVAGSDVSNYWEVLNRGQATRSAAIVLEDGRWLDDAAAAAGVPKSSLTVTAGAIPDTTLITVSVEADSAKAAEAGLQSVLGHALNQAAQVSGPFKLEVIASPEGSAQPQSPRPVELVAAFGVAGLLVGAGAGLLVSRALQARNPQTVGGRRRARRARRDQAESGTNSFRAQTVGDPPDITTPRR